MLIQITKHSTNKMWLLWCFISIDNSLLCFGYTTLLLLHAVLFKVLIKSTCPRVDAKTVSFVWLVFIDVCFQMSPQTACLSGCIVTLFTLVRLFSTVYFQMCPQVACLRGCIITLVASDWFFSTVCHQMNFQTAWLRGCIVALVTLTWFFTSMHFQMRP